MIKKPVTIGSVGTSSFHTHSQYPLLMSNFKPFNLDQCNEAAKRINMHDELAFALKDLIEIVGELEECDAKRINKSFRWICEIHQNAIKVLEQCK